jgi:proteasome activator subunit 4
MLFIIPALSCQYVDALAKFFVYSMSLDGPIRGESGTSPSDGVATTQTGYLAGSRALDSLDKLITSTESYFHPSNHGHWTLAVGKHIHLVFDNFA